MFFALPSRTFVTLLVVLLMTSALAEHGKKKKHGDKDHGGGKKHGDHGDDGTPGIIVEDVARDLVSGNRAVLIVCRFSDRFILVVSGSAGKGDLEGGLVFDQSKDTMDGNSIQLLQPKTVRDKWPSLVKLKAGAMFIATDSTTNRYILVVSGNKTYAVNMNGGAKSEVPLSPSTQGYILHQKISSSEELMVYTFGFLGKGLVTKYRFRDSDLTKSSFLDGQSLSAPYICSAGQGKVVAKTTECSSRVDWDIQAGYIDSESFFFFDQDNSATYFTKSALNSPNSPVPLTTIAAKDFFKVLKHSTSLPSTSVTHKRKKTIAIVVIVIVVIICILSLVAIVYFVFFYKQSPAPIKADDSFASKGLVLLANSSVSSKRRALLGTAKQSSSPSVAKQKQPSKPKVTSGGGTPKTISKRKQTSSKGSTTKKRRTSSKRTASKKRSSSRHSKKRPSRRASSRKASTSNSINAKL